MPFFRNLRVLRENVSTPTKWKYIRQRPITIIERMYHFVPSLLRDEAILFFCDSSNE